MERLIEIIMNEIDDKIQKEEQYYADENLEEIKNIRIGIITGLRTAKRIIETYKGE